MNTPFELPVETDSPTMDAGAESCVSEVMKSGYTEEAASKICATRLQKSIQATGKSVPIKNTRYNLKDVFKKWQVG